LQQLEKADEMEVEHFSQPIVTGTEKKSSQEKASPKKVKAVHVCI